MADDERASHTPEPGTGQPRGESTEESLIAELQAELEASLAAGIIPNGWTHKVSWESSGGVSKFVVAAIVVVIGVAAGWITWGWRAGIAAGIVVIGLISLFSIRGGPRPGATITESFIPPDETVMALGVARHELVKVTRSPPEFSLTRVATSADQSSVRLSVAAIGAAATIGGVLTILVESGRISPTTYLRVGSVIGAAVSAGAAIWLWRRIGKYLKLDTYVEDTERESLTEEVLGSVTTGGSSVEALGTGLLARLPLRVARVVAPAISLLTGALAVLVAFSLTPDASELWSSAIAAGDLVAFTLVGGRALLLAGIGLLRRNWSAFRAALWMLVLMAVLLLAAKVFGWLDEWAAVISSIRGWIP